MPSQTSPTGAGAQGLTKRELEVVRLDGMGLINAQIAQEMHISRKTLEGHKTNLRRKLGLKPDETISSFAQKPA